ncbi:hypothetical protein [Halomonas stenophila]|uniref:Putative nuclease with RNAse H fold n=1 Tax=Halomonas stenophila TaxID=795312 RepID=A0A7W5EUZ6_9GAMM|nr:hypothetical protein [Halomonas stenophila]MBB3231932.1 putative nuclease with RNAse H fold [Halomonas stenophila]
MIHLSEAEVVALEKFKKRVSETHPDAEYSAARRGKGHPLELDVLIDQLGIPGAEAIQAAANDVLVTDGVYIVPHVSLRGPDPTQTPLDRLRGSVKSFHRPFDPADE